MFSSQSAIVAAWTAAALFQNVTEDKIINLSVDTQSYIRCNSFTDSNLKILIENILAISRDTANHSEELYKLLLTIHFAKSMDNCMTFTCKGLVALYKV